MKKGIDKSNEKEYNEDRGEKKERYEKAMKLSEADFKQIIGVKKDTFEISVGGAVSEDKKVQGDSGYQGILKLHRNSETPKKKPKGGQLADDEKAENKRLSTERMLIEHVNAKVKVFKINHIYSYKYGVYDIVSQTLSSNQEILWRITDEEIEKEEIPNANSNNNAPQPDWVKDYFSKISDETKQAQKKQADFMNKLVNSLSGIVCDLATGMGGNLQRLLEAEAKGFQIVCTDIDRRILAMTRKNKKTDDARVFYIATDGRHMSIKNKGA